MASLAEFYIEKEKRELITAISYAKYISEGQKETMIGVLEDNENQWWEATPAFLKDSDSLRKCW